MSNWNLILDYLMEIVTLKNVIIFSILYFFVIWISLLVWVIKDITNRTDKLYLQIIWVLTILIFTPFWIFLYLLIRPHKTLFEQYYSEVESNLECLSEDIVEKIGKKNFNIIKCKNCKKEISEEFKYCPYCKTKIAIKEKIKDKKVVVKENTKVKVKKKIKKAVNKVKKIIKKEKDI